MKSLSLSSIIIRNVLLFCIALFFLTLFIFYYFSRQTIEQTTRDNAVLLADKTVNRIEQELLTAQKIPENIAWMLESAILPKDSIENFLRSIIENNPNAYGAAVAFEPNRFPKEGMYFAPYAWKDGDDIKSTKLGSDRYDYFYMDWYQIPAMIRKPYWTEPYFDDGGGNIIMSSYSVPFYINEKGERSFAGVVTVDISLDWLTKIIKSVKIFDTGYAFLLSANGEVISHPNHDYIMNETIFTVAKKSDDNHLAEIGRKMIKGGSDFTFIQQSSKGKHSIYYTRLPSNKWSLGVIFPDREMFAPLRRITWILLIIVIAGLILLSVFVTGITNRITAPLRLFAKSAKLIAGGDFVTVLPEIKKGREMLELHHSFEFMQKSLAEYIEKIQETTVAKEKIESELRIAKEIQMSMIPHIFPPFPNLSQIDLYGIIKPAKEVGGDLYDFFMIDDDHLCFVIGDVSGKGIPASLFMAVTRTLLRSVAVKKLTPADIVTKLNKSLSANNESCMFVTFFLGIIDINTGETQYTNAGHNPFIHISEDQVNYRKVNPAMVLGAFEDAVFTNERMTLKKNDMILMYTDGVTEAMDHDEKLFGEKRLLELLEDSDSWTVKQVISNTMNGIAEFVKDNEQSDDITMLVLKYLS